jgi:hypothetical protein
LFGLPPRLGSSSASASTTTYPSVPIVVKAAPSAHLGMPDTKAMRIPIAREVAEIEPLTITISVGRNSFRIAAGSVDRGPYARRPGLIGQSPEKPCRSRRRAFRAPIWPGVAASRPRSPAPANIPPPRRTRKLASSSTAVRSRLRSKRGNRRIPSHDDA